MCPSSYCAQHRDGLLFISKLDGKLCCSEHDPCGPDPLEPGEIREYTAPVAPAAMGPSPFSKAGAPPGPGATADANAAAPQPAVGSAVGLAVAASAKPLPPPRLYINTKTATSSFLPTGRAYGSDGSEGPVSSPEGSSKGPGEEEEQVRLSAHTLLLPTRGQLEARMMVTAFELGLDNVTEDSVSTMIYAVEVRWTAPPVTSPAPPAHGGGLGGPTVMSGAVFTCLEFT
jgi:hypothetical protein